jgi:hypothetical protein
VYGTPAGFKLQHGVIRDEVAPGPGLHSADGHHRDLAGRDLAEQLLRMRLLEVLRADLGLRDLRRDRQHRHPAPVGVEQAVDQVQVARPAAARADRQLTSQRRLRARRERGRLLVPHVLPGDPAVPAQRVGEPIEGVTGNPEHPAHP